MSDALCASCGTLNREGRKFCAECGSTLAAACPACGAANEPGEKFCGECGAPLVAQPEPKPAAAAPTQAERRLVTVLFADLVGYTALSEGRDFEDVRDLQTRYFDTARTVIERYGGTVEKFIGDAVMAVWGAPIAREDDAERAVRGALDLVAAIPDIDPALQARAGVLTGEAAVTVGAATQGMVTGDLVNTASRIQSAAEPGAVLVGEATRRATEAAIAYAQAGEHELKGKAEPVHLWQALRVIANRGGEGRSVGVEAPFVGRERELRLAKELFHATADDRTARLLSIVGTAGMGKSRLSWEFEKYIDGLADDAYWHRGRCLAYGEGVAYWALADMVRMRARITEDEPAETAIAKLREVITQMIDDPEERAFVEPRLQHLLGLTERVAPDREDLFSAWRLFVERMAERFPVIMVFEDIHWADAALVEFIESLLERSRTHPIFVLTLARPDVTERHPGWGSRLRSFTSITLDPLGDDSIDALLRGLVPGIDGDALARIRERAEGIPFYAVETVRMLLDRGLLEPGDAGYRVTGDLSSLQVPETLQTLIAARLDGLELDERRLLQDASVLGKTFATRGLVAVAGYDEDSLRPRLDALVRKELLYLETDPFSPERGQYGFLQALVQRVAYETLARRDRKAKHLAAARYLTADAGLDPDEIAEVIAAHYLDAAQADEDAPDVGEIRAEARAWLERAGDRATSLAAAEEAQRAYEAASELADGPSERAALLERAGRMARMGGQTERAEQLFTQARDLHLETGDRHAAARAAAGIARAAWRVGRTNDAIAIGEEAFAALASDEPDADVGVLAAELARLHYFAGNHDQALERVDAALAIGERLRLPELLSGTLNTKALVLGLNSPHQAHGLQREALRIALEHDLVFEALRAYNNIAITLDRLDRIEDVLPVFEQARELARRRGDREWSEALASSVVTEHALRGNWDEAEALGAELDALTLDVQAFQALIDLADVQWRRGRDQLATDTIGRTSAAEPDEDQQWQVLLPFRERVVAAIEGRHDVAVDIALGTVESLLGYREVDADLAQGLRAAATFVPDSRDRRAAAETAAHARVVFRDGTSRQITAQLARLEGVLAALAGDHDAAVQQFGVALAAARSLGFSPWTGEILVDYADSLIADGRTDDAEPLLTEAREIAERLRYVRLLDRIMTLEPAPGSEVPAG